MRTHTRAKLPLHNLLHTCKYSLTRWPLAGFVLSYLQDRAKGKSGLMVMRSSSRKFLHLITCGPDMKSTLGLSAFCAHWHANITFSLWIPTLLALVTFCTGRVPDVLDIWSIAYWNRINNSRWREVAFHFIPHSSWRSVAVVSPVAIPNY